MTGKITVEAKIAAPIQEVWRAWNTPDDIRLWNAASDDWHTTKSEVDLRAGGAFSSRMEARDGSMGFDFAGTYTKVVEHKLIESAFGDRVLLVEFISEPDGVTVLGNHILKVENFGYIFFGELLIGETTRRLTMLRLQLGSDTGGSSCSGESKPNGQTT